jgi:transposase-like protein
MKKRMLSYRGHRFPTDIISRAVWLYHRFCLSFRDVEYLLAERGITVSYETIRQWCRKFRTEHACRLKRREGRLGDTWYLDEVFANIQGQRQYLWRAVTAGPPREKSGEGHGRRRVDRGDVGSEAIESADTLRPDFSPATQERLR